MDAQAIVSVSASVVLLTQLAKHFFDLPENRGGYVVLSLALLGTLLWYVSCGCFTRAQIFPFFAAFVAIAAAAAGVFGFARTFNSLTTTRKETPAV